MLNQRIWILVPMPGEGPACLMNKTALQGDQMKGQLVTEAHDFIKVFTFSPAF